MKINRKKSITLLLVIPGLFLFQVRTALASNEDTTGYEGFEIVEIQSRLDHHLQRAYFRKSTLDMPVPLIVSLHTWSGDYSQEDPLAGLCKLKDLNYIHPDFRGANNRVEACCSELALNDIDQAITYAIENARVDTSQIFVIGVSGGGYATIAAFMRSKHQIAKFSAWVPITDLKAWYSESAIRKAKYAQDVLDCTASENGILNEVMAEERSPLYWRTPLTKLSRSELYIYAGVYDGIQGSVPITHSINFYNKVLSDLWVTDSSKYVSDREKLHLLEHRKPTGDFGTIAGRNIFLMKKQGNIKLTLFEGNHEMLTEYAFSELMEERLGCEGESISDEQKAIEAAVPKAERDPTRPVYHFRPPAQWMNDICGAIFYKGYYHIFYQLNPFADIWGAIHTCWGHVRSKDLATWEHLPIALVPQREKGELRCNSGSVALGGDGTPMIFYTFVPANEMGPNVPKNVTRLGKREQWVAKACDDELIEWKRIENNPILAAGTNGVPQAINGGWSDPFVFKSDGRTMMTFKSSSGLVAEAQNKELTSWKAIGNIEGVEGECPNFFRLGEKWVLLRSTYPPTYLTGTFDPDKLKFTPDQDQPSTLDYVYGPVQPDNWSRGFYGTNVLFDENNRCILFGWISGFKSGRGWNGCMSLPRILTLQEDGKLLQTPAPELKKLRGTHHQVKNIKVGNGSVYLDDFEGKTVEIMASLKPAGATAFGLRLRCGENGEGGVVLKYAEGVLDVAGTKVPVDLSEASKTLDLHIFLDRSVMEVFINGGRSCVTSVIYPGEEDRGLSLFSEHGKVNLKSLDMWEINPVW